MPTAPQVDYCLLCDDIRLEAGNKATLLGYYGMLPRVKVLLKEWGKALDRLVFMVSFREATGPFAARLKVINPDGSDFLEVGPIEGGPTATPNDNAVIAFGLIGIVFKQQGKYQVEIAIGDAKAYDSALIVEEQSAEDKLRAGRNDPCPCGSGKKFKKCHGAPPL